LALAPGAALGLYLGRLLSELWAELAGSTPLPLAIGITIVAVISSAYLTRKIQFTRSWPALLLLIYVLYPEANLKTALLAGICSLLVWWLAEKKLQIQSRNNKVVLLMLLTFSVIFLLLYLITLAPDLLPADSGEFQVVATNLGVAHPPGFSLYTILAHLMTRLPLGPTPAYRVNLLSAISSTLTLTILYVAVHLLTKRHLAAFISILALGTATTFWAQATTANIRSLSAFFTAVMFVTLLAFYKNVKRTGDNSISSQSDRYLILFALALGLGVTHHASLSFMALIFIIFIILADPSLMRSPGRWWRSFLALLLGLLPLLYLFFRASSGARGASPDLATLPGFLEHVLALGFRGDLFTYLEPALFWERLKIMGNVLTFQFEPMLLLGMILGLFLLLWCDWRLAFLLGGSFLIHTFVTATYRAPQTVEYMLPAYIPLAILLGYGAGKLDDLGQVPGFDKFQRMLQPIILSILLVAAFWQLSQHYPSFKQLHTDKTAREYAEPILNDAPQGSVILADWHWVTPLWYLQEVEGKRQDVTIRFVFPEGEPYGETWARRINEELANGRSVISTHFDTTAYQDLPPPEPIEEAFLFRQAPHLDLPAGFTSLDTVIGERLQLVGYKLEEKSVEVADEATLTLAWMPLIKSETLITLFAHLVGSNGKIYAQEDLPANAQQQGITLTQFHLTPRIGALPGEYDVLVGASAEETLANDQGQTRTLLSSLTVSSQEQPQATGHPTSRRILGDSPLRLIGYDWDNTLSDSPRLYLHWHSGDGFLTEVLDGSADGMPTYAGPWGVPSNRWVSIATPGKGYYVPLGQGIIWQGEQIEGDLPLSAGQSLTLSQHFLSSRPVMRDYAVSTRLIGFENDGYHWAWWDLDDAIPAMGAIPTLKWITDSRVRSPHFLTVDPTATPDQQIGGVLNLYDAFTGRSLPILDERITAEYGWIPLGFSTVSD